ncbi:large subunit ribosomal protein L10 [Lachnospiraceae bacterium PF1-21]|uniref:Large ribosomal subunit protein uL10 n=1 Tax=Ohessyouella blattaphilus TaxID=2949333 RepID=A0ABT1EKB7_9FIRM|nr:50S ribosomal protein L10 [Ohessyouella blattaphilus]MCP1110976.1 50S ribosomal protein L10 [Ohessyouella blattaphilus]MCR8564370.1 50S ribosomal protein L10 [Ohessyouella blattaphilus]
MAKVELKQPIINKIAEEVKDAASVVLVDYRGLTVAEDTELRRTLRDAGIIYKVYKNTMMKRAFEGTEFAGLDEYLAGPSAIAISKDDATAAARILAKFAKTAQALEMKAGVVEGNVYDENGMKELASVPSREELLSKLLGSLQSPITNLARVLNQIAEAGPAVEAVPAAEEAAAEAPAEEAAPVAEEAVAEAPAEEATEEVKEETTEA